MKIDVDGIEHLILAGARRVLAQESIRTILIEVNESFEVHRTSVTAQLTKAGFELRGKFHSELTANGKFQDSYNQIWIR